MFGVITKLCPGVRLAFIATFHIFTLTRISPSDGPGGHREAPRPDLTASAPPNSGTPSTYPFMCRPEILPPWGPKRRFKVSFFGRFRRKKGLHGKNRHGHIVAPIEPQPGQDGSHAFWLPARPFGSARGPSVRSAICLDGRALFRPRLFQRTTTDAKTIAGADFCHALTPNSVQTCPDNIFRPSQNFSRPRRPVRPVERPPLHPP